MVIYIGDDPIISVPNSIDIFFDINPKLKTLAYSFRSKDVVTVSHNWSLHISQGEYAVFPSANKSIQIIGSEDATTCHILLLTHISGWCAIMHLDGRTGEDEAIQKVFDELEENEGCFDTIDAYIMGGYNAPSETRVARENLSEKLSLMLLSKFEQCPHRVNLKLLCTCKLNTMYRGNEPFPATYGIAFDRRNQDIFPATFCETSLYQKISSAFHWTRSFSMVYCFYNYRKNILTIPPFSWWDKDKFSFYASLPDNKLLTHFSTSPLVEPPTFCQHLRDVFSMLGEDTSDNLIQQGKEKTFVLDDAGHWEEE